MATKKPRVVKVSWTGSTGALSYRIIQIVSGVETTLQSALNSTNSEIEFNLLDVALKNPQIFVEACDQTACVRSTQSLSAQSLLNSLVGYIKASNSATGANFGSVALSGDGKTMAIGAAFENSNATGINGDQSNTSASNSGAVYVFTKSGVTWTQEAYIKASNTDSGDTFGTAVRLSQDGNTLAVTAPSEDSNASGVNGDGSNNLMSGSGAAYIFIRANSVWSQQAYLKSSNPDIGDGFGSQLSVSADGNTLAVGASGESSNSSGINGNQASNALSSSGAVYIFTRSLGTWTQSTYIKASNPNSLDNFGARLSLSGDGLTLAVGAPKEASNATGINGNQNDNSLANAGAIYIFTYAAAAWSQQAYIKPSVISTGENFGININLSYDGDTLAAGVATEASNATGINGNAADTSAAQSGAVFVFSRSGINWSQQAYIKSSNSEAGDVFGSSTALSADGNTLAVSAPGESSNALGIGGDQTNNLSSQSGAVYIFKRAGSVWTQFSYLKPPVFTGATRNFGFKVALSDDGQSIAVGDNAEGGSATGIGGDPSSQNHASSGCVYLF